MTATPPQQYCLRWNNYQNNLTNVFDQLLQSEAFVDVTLACDGHSLKAHKMVLSACSPYFQSLFCDNPCSHPIVILKDVKWDELKAIVEFMYRGEINVSQEQLAPLLKVAEVLKIRGLADVSRGTSAEFVSAAAAAAAATSSGGGSGGCGGNGNNGSGGGSSGNNFSSNGNNINCPIGPPQCSAPDSDGEMGPLGSSSRLTLHPSSSSALSTFQLQHPSLFHHPQHGIGINNGHHLLASLGRSMRHPTKRRRFSTSDDRSPSPADTLEDHSHSGSGHLEIESNPGDYENSREGITPGPGSTSAALISLGLTPTPANTPTGVSNTCGSPNGAGSSGMNHGVLSSSLMSSLHNAAAAAAAAAASNPGSSSSISNDLDLKPGIVEMIREEERAKMLESSHGWLGPSAASTLSDSYQYQIQSLWQKCWSTNQSGMVHALRFRERGPLKSWRPETMAEAIFSVLREGLSLSQAARKYDIPYPTFVLYANRVHNMLGPSTDGCSDMRPKGRGRPQRILLGSWPEEHIRGVIRAVVFRDTAKDDIPFVYNRESSMCMPPPQPGSSHNGLDMSIHPQFAGSPMSHFLNLQHSQGPGGSSSSTPSNSHSSAVALIGSSSSTNDSISCLNPGASVQVELGHTSSSGSSNSNSPLGNCLSRSNAAGVQQIQLMAAAAAAAAQEQREQNLLTSFKSSSAMSSSSIGNSSSRKSLRYDDHHLRHGHGHGHGLVHDHDIDDEDDDDDDDGGGIGIGIGPIPIPEMLQIKAEIPFDDVDDDMDDDPEDNLNSEDDDVDSHILHSNNNRNNSTSISSSSNNNNKLDSTKSTSSSTNTTTNTAPVVISTLSSSSSSSSNVIPGPSSSSSVITGGIGLGLGLGGGLQQVEGHFRQREMNTPSPHFQSS